MNAQAQKLLMQTPSNEVRKFTLADMNECGQWMLTRMREHWPAVSDANFAGHVRQIMGANDRLLVRTAQAVALADLTYEPFDPRPVVRVVFAWTFVKREHMPKLEGKDHEINQKVKQEGDRQVVRLVRACQAWAQNMRAKRVDLGQNLDLGPGPINGQLVPGKREELWIPPEVRKGPGGAA